MSVNCELRHNYIGLTNLKNEFQGDARYDKNDIKKLINLWLMIKTNSKSLEFFDQQRIVECYIDEINSFENIDALKIDIINYIEKIDSPSTLAYWICNLNHEQIKHLFVEEMKSRSW